MEVEILVIQLGDREGQWLLRASRIPPHLAPQESAQGRMLLWYFRGEGGYTLILAQSFQNTEGIVSLPVYGAPL